MLFELTSLKRNEFLLTGKRLVTRIDLSQNSQKQTLGIIIPFAVLALLAVVARFWARRVQKLRYELDDHLSVVSLVMTTHPTFLYRTCFLLFPPLLLPPASVPQEIRISV